MGFDRLAEKMGACSNAKRLEILKLLSKEDYRTTDIYQKIKISQSSVSQHLRTLLQAGLVKRRTKGVEAWYSINRSAMYNIAVNFSELGHVTKAVATAARMNHGHKVYQKAMEGLIDERTADTI